MRISGYTLAPKQSHHIWLNYCQIVTANSPRYTLQQPLNTTVTGRLLLTPLTLACVTVSMGIECRGFFISNQALSVETCNPFSCWIVAVAYTPQPTRNFFPSLSDLHTWMCMRSVYSHHICYNLNFCARGDCATKLLKHLLPCLGFNPGVWVNSPARFTLDCWAHYYVLDLGIIWIVPD